MKKINIVLATVFCGLIFTVQFISAENSKHKMKMHWQYLPSKLINEQIIKTIMEADDCSKINSKSRGGFLKYADSWRCINIEESDIENFGEYAGFRLKGNKQIPGAVFMNEKGCPSGYTPFIFDPMIFKGVSFPTGFCGNYKKLNTKSLNYKIQLHICYEKSPLDKIANMCETGITFLGDTILDNGEKYVRYNPVDSVLVDETTKANIIEINIGGDVRRYVIAKRHLKIDYDKNCDVVMDFYYYFYNPSGPRLERAKFKKTTETQKRYKNYERKVIKLFDKNPEHGAKRADVEQMLGKTPQTEKINHNDPD